MRSPREAERRLCQPEDELTGRQSSVRYSGAAPTIQCRTRKAIYICWNLWLPLSHGMCPRDLPLPCNMHAFPHEKLQWQGPSRSHPLPRTLGIGYHVIFHPFPLFLLSGRDSSIIFFQLLSPVFLLHPLTSRFVMLSHPRM